MKRLEHETLGYAPDRPFRSPFLWLHETGPRAFLASRLPRRRPSASSPERRLASVGGVETTGRPMIRGLNRAADHSLGLLNPSLALASPRSQRPTTAWSTSSARAVRFIFSALGISSFDARAAGLSRAWREKGATQSWPTLTAQPHFSPIFEQASSSQARCTTRPGMSLRPVLPSSCLPVRTRPCAFPCRLPRPPAVAVAVREY